MSQLSLRDRELVAIGAALAANCIPCIEFHIPKARQAGISDEELQEALKLADKVRQVPAKKVLDVANASLEGSDVKGGSSYAQCEEMMGSDRGNNSCC